MNSRGSYGERLGVNRRERRSLERRAQAPRALLQVAIDRFQRDKSDPSVIVFSEIKRCQLPHSTQFFKKQKSRRGWRGLNSC